MQGSTGKLRACRCTLTARVKPTSQFGRLQGPRLGQVQLGAGALDHKTSGKVYLQPGGKACRSSAAARSPAPSRLMFSLPVPAMVARRSPRADPAGMAMS